MGAGGKGPDTLYISLLPPEYLEDQLQQEFQRAGVTNYAHMNLKRTSDGRSRGFMFLEFERNEDAEDARQKLTSLQINGKPISVQWAEFQRLDEEVMSKVRAIFVSGLPGSTTDEDMRTLFGQYGPLERVTVPRKFEDATQAKGFAFLDFQRREDALEAIKHLNGSVFRNYRIAVELARPDGKKGQERRSGGPPGERLPNRGPPPPRDRYGGDYGRDRDRYGDRDRERDRYGDRDARGPPRMGPLGLTEAEMIVAVELEHALLQKAAAGLGITGPLPAMLNTGSFAQLLNPALSMMPGHMAAAPAAAFGYGPAGFGAAAVGALFGGAQAGPAGGGMGGIVVPPSAGGPVRPPHAGGARFAPY
eukprot:tig00020961_g16670.t1